MAEKIGRRAIDPSSSDNCHPTKRIVRYKNVSYYCAKYCLLLTCLHTHCGPICIVGLHWNGRHLIPSTKLTSSSHNTFHFSYMKVLDEMFIKVKESSIFKEKNNSG